jgi:hypothetical protein
VKRKTLIAHMNSIVVTYKKGIVALVESINCIHELNLQIEENHTRAQER